MSKAEMQSQPEDIVSILIVNIARTTADSHFKQFIPIHVNIMQSSETYVHLVNT